MWTDHVLITFTLRYSSSTSGKRLWRANPVLAQSTAFQSKLSKDLTAAWPTIQLCANPQEAWDATKKIVQQSCRQHGRYEATKRQRRERHLQRLRNGMLRAHKLTNVLSPRFQAVCNELGQLQETNAYILSLKAGIRWREQGETSAGYLKRTSRQRLAQRQIPELEDPLTGHVGSSMEHMHQAACNFYQTLYSTEDIDQHAIDRLFSHIPSSCTLTSNDCSYMEAPLTHQDLKEAVKRAPKSSSPGMDGLPYTILSLLFKHELYTELLLRVSCVQ